jgi:hypothetical protein
LLQGLTDARNIAMSENSETPLKEPILFAIALAVLVLEKRNNGLRHRQASSHEVTDSWNRAVAATLRVMLILSRGAGEDRFPST